MLMMIMIIIMIRVNVFSLTASWLIGDTFLRTGTLVYYMTYKLMILPKT